MKFMGRSKWELDTPCLVLDRDILEANIQNMQGHAAAWGKQLRPHAKTHKCTRIARMQAEAGCVGICAAKVSEAEILVQEGCRGVLVTSPVVTGQKIRRLLACASIAPDLMVVVDHPENAQGLSRAAVEQGLTLNVLVDLDPGMGRTGVPFAQGLDLADLLNGLPGLNLCGVQCYAGHVQHIASFEDRRMASVDCMGRAAEVVRGMRAAGLPCGIFTGGGTGTHDIDCGIPEVSELQVGSYVMMDAEYLAVGSAADPARFAGFPPALTILTTVISVNRPDFVTVDAGLKTLYHHGGAPTVVRPEGLALRYEWFGDEQGMLLYQGETRSLRLGQVVELVVSHCDPTVNLFDVLHVTSGDAVVDLWPIDMRGCSR